MLLMAAGEQGQDIMQVSIALLRSKPQAPVAAGAAGARMRLCPHGDGGGGH